MNAVEFKNVYYKYGETDNVFAVDNLTLNIEKGEFAVILGRNGSGKSTAAKLMNGLLQPFSGDVTVFGMNTKDKDKLFEIRKRAGMVFQNPDNQMIASIVEDDVAFGPENIGLPREEIGKRIDYALKATDMESFRHSSGARLSGGQKQRIAIAGVLAVKPEVLILDESTAMLDPKGRKEVMDVVKNLNREEGITVILITHYMDEATEADRIYVMKDGSLFAEGTPKKIFSEREKLNSVGLEVPKAAYLAEELRRVGVPVGKDILTREELSESLCKLLRKI